MTKTKTRKKTDKKPRPADVLWPDDINRDDIRRDNSERGKIKRDDIKRDDIRRDDRGVSTAPNCRRAVHRPVSCIARHRTRRVDLHGEPHARSGLA